MSDLDETVDLYDPARATAQYVRAIVLLMFAGLISGLAVAVASSAASAGWIVAVGGVAALVVVIRAVWIYLDGNMFLKR